MEEFRQYEQSLYNLVLEDLLTYDDPQAELEKVYKAEIKKNPIDHHVRFFPDDNSTVGADEIFQIYRELDRDNDSFVSAEDVAELFKENKVELTRPFLKRISQAIRQLNYQTYQPLELDGFFYSSADFVLTY